MSTRNKKGFTLIELMVVIVIIGILAAIAIPKLFGMSAKAKAQEVGPAVGSWAKMQQAYKMETGNYSSYDTIGYKVPGPGGGNADGKDSTSNFTYNVPKTAYTFTATSRFASDPCGQGSSWGASFTANQSADDPTVTLTAATGGNSTVAGCQSLTPNYCNIGVKGTGCN